jgi:ATPase subunit of ABC transporter with duplicated ATPase domains
MGFLDAGGLTHALPDGRTLFTDVDIRIGDGAKVALIGANGAGKTTVMRLLAGDLTPQSGTVVVTGGLGVMRQFIGSVRDETTVGQFLLSLATPALRKAAANLDAAELQMMEHDDEPTQLRYAHALSEWGEIGGYELEVVWDVVTVAALGIAFDACKYREVTTLSGGEQKRLALEYLLRGPDEVLLLDEPDNYLDVPGKRWLEQRLAESSKTVLFVTHDRELLAASAQRLITIEGGEAWVHAGRFDTYPAAREARHEKLADARKRWDEEYIRLRDLTRTMQQQAKISPDLANRYHAMKTRFEKFEAVGPPPDRPESQPVAMRLTGGRTGQRVVTCEKLGLPGLIEPFDLELYYGDRVALLGANGAGKSHLLRLFGGDDSVAATGEWRLGARVHPGLFMQTHTHPEWADRPLVDLLWAGEGSRGGLDRGKAMGALRRYALGGQGDQTFGSLSGGQQARFQILLLELTGSTLLLLDEPTDNLDVLSADSLQEALAAFDGTVVAVTHDRWFAKSFDRFLVVDSDSTLTEHSEPVWDTTRAVRG